MCIPRSILRWKKISLQDKKKDPVRRQLKGKNLDVPKNYSLSGLIFNDLLSLSSKQKGADIAENRWQVLVCESSKIVIKFVASHKAIRPP